MSEPNFPQNRYKIVARSARETAGPDRPAARNSGVRTGKVSGEKLLKRELVSIDRVLRRGLVRVVQGLIHL